MQWQLIVKLSFETEKINEKNTFWQNCLQSSTLKSLVQKLFHITKKEVLPFTYNQGTDAMVLQCDVGQWTYPKVHICKMVMITVPVL